MKRFELDGNDFNNLTDFFSNIGNLLVENNDWGRNWDALNDILDGGFLKTEYKEEFELIWFNSDKSKTKLIDFKDIVKLIKEHKHIKLELK